MLKPRRLALIAVATALLAGQALADSDGDWKLRIKREGNGWTASFSGPQAYGSSARSACAWRTARPIW
ncbi:hypothetical protein BH11PSE10_BH11PSE10_16570 [soil metagenome]